MYLSSSHVSLHEFYLLDCICQLFVAIFDTLFEEFCKVISKTDDIKVSVLRQASDKEDQSLSRFFYPLSSHRSAPI